MKELRSHVTAGLDRDFFTTTYKHDSGGVQPDSAEFVSLFKNLQDRISDEIDESEAKKPAAKKPAAKKQSAKKQSAKKQSAKKKAAWKYDENQDEDDDGKVIIYLPAIK